MNQSENEVQIYIRMPARLVKKLDTYQTRMGFGSRAEMFRGFALLIIDEFSRQEDELLFKTAAEFKNGCEGKEKLTEHQISCRLQELIGSMAKPVIAVKGPDAACNAALYDIQDAFHEEHGIWLTEDEIRDGFHMYDLTNKPALRDYLMGLKHQKEGDNI